MAFLALQCVRPHGAWMWYIGRSTPCSAEMVSHLGCATALTTHWYLGTMAWHCVMIQYAHAIRVHYLFYELQMGADISLCYFISVAWYTMGRVHRLGVSWSRPLMDCARCSAHMETGKAITRVSLSQSSPDHDTTQRIWQLPACLKSNLCNFYTGLKIEASFQVQLQCATQRPRLVITHRQGRLSLGSYIPRYHS